jgi:hypothetical protein
MSDAGCCSKWNDLKGLNLVGAAGLEPATLGLEIRCSIHLSYAPSRTTTRAILSCSHSHSRGLREYGPNFRKPKRTRRRFLNPPIHNVA